MLDVQLGGRSLSSYVGRFSYAVCGRMKRSRPGPSSIIDAGKAIQVVVFVRFMSRVQPWPWWPSLLESA